MKLLAVDGNSIMNRAFYGIKLLSNSKGRFTNAVTGFMNIYLKEIAAVSPDHVAVAFDLKAPTFRHKASAAYKANRKGMPEELAEQIGNLEKRWTDFSCAANYYCNHAVVKSVTEKVVMLSAYLKTDSKTDAYATACAIQALSKEMKNESLPLIGNLL